MSLCLMSVLTVEGLEVMSAYVTKTTTVNNSSVNSLLDKTVLKKPFETIFPSRKRKCFSFCIFLIVFYSKVAGTTSILEKCVQISKVEVKEIQVMKDCQISFMIRQSL